MPYAATEPLGRLFLVGGAEDRLGRRTILRRFVEAGGGPSARIVVLPTASALGDEITEVYTTLFTRLGAADVVAVRPESREEAEDPALARLVAEATAVFMTGGNQLKLSAVVAGTGLAEAMHRAYAGGAVIAGTSAGASVMSEHMVAFGTEGPTPRQRMSQLAAGLGLLPGVIVDQHFEQRSRHGRLLSLVAQSPSLLGLGVDEDTAAVVTGGRYLEVVGTGAVFVVDGRAAVSNAHEAERSAPLLVSGAVVHTLPAGARFDLRERVLLDFVETRPAEEIGALATATAQARAAARRIAASR